MHSVQFNVFHYTSKKIYDVQNDPKGDVGQLEGEWYYV